MSIPFSAYFKTIHILLVTGLVIGFMSLAFATGSFACNGGGGGGGGGDSGADSGGGSDDANAGARRRKNVFGKRNTTKRRINKRRYVKKKRRVTKKKRRTVKRTSSRPVWTPPVTTVGPVSEGERGLFENPWPGRDLGTRPPDITPQPPVTQRPQPVAPPPPMPMPTPSVPTGPSNTELAVETVRDVNSVIGPLADGLAPGLEAVRNLGIHNVPSAEPYISNANIRSLVRGANGTSAAGQAINIAGGFITASNIALTTVDMVQASNAEEYSQSIDRYVETIIGTIGAFAGAAAGAVIGGTVAVSTALPTGGIGAVVAIAATPALAVAGGVAGSAVVRSRYNESLPGLPGYSISAGVRAVARGYYNAIGSFMSWARS